MLVPAKEKSLGDLCTISGGPCMAGPHTAGSNKLRMSPYIRSLYRISSQSKVLTMQVQPCSGDLCISGPYSVGSNYFRLLYMSSHCRVKQIQDVPIYQVPTIQVQMNSGGLCASGPHTVFPHRERSSQCRYKNFQEVSVYQVPTMQVQTSSRALCLSVPTLFPDRAWSP